MSVVRVPAPASLHRTAELFRAGSKRPVPPRDAATVVLLRDAERGPELYLLSRHTQMAFAPGMAVFPGGGVDERDRTSAVDAGSWVGPSPDQWAARLGCDSATARALVVTAVRETFEETGVLLAGPDGHTTVPDTTTQQWEADRAALSAKEVSLADVLLRRGLRLRTDLLTPWAHWITPDYQPLRYDTRFFVALLPAQQHTRDVSTESDAVLWARPADALAAVEAGQLSMLPPTLRTCAELAEVAVAADALQLGRHRVITPLTSWLVVDDDGVWLESNR
jgi:8-oxo-dGTP pyrophosphatase MutT (NUDIX family)